MRRVARPLLYLGIVAIVLGLAKIHAKYIGDYVLHSTEPSRLAWTLAYLGLLVVTSYGAGLPDLPRTRRQAITSAVLAPLAAAGCISIVQLLTGDALLPRFVVFGAAVLLVPWNLACIAIARGGRTRDERRDRVALVAEHGEAVALRDELQAEPERPATIVTSLRPEEATSTGSKSKPLCEQALAAGATVIVLDRAALAEHTIVSQAASMHEAGIRVRTLSLFYEQWLGKLPASELERVSLLFDIRELHGSRYLRVKRLVDLCFGVVGLLAFVVAVPFVALGNLFANRGPLLYRQPRVGKNGRVFEIIKFRTMRSVHGSSPNEWTSEDDPRITRFGRVLRRTHLDELPQAINIVRG